MKIIINLDVMLARRKMKLKELAALIGLSEQNLSMIKTGKVKGVRFDTLMKICDVLDCQPGDILEFSRDAECSFEATRDGSGRPRPALRRRMLDLELERRRRGMARKPVPQGVSPELRRAAGILTAFSLASRRRLLSRL